MLQCVPTVKLRKPNYTVLHASILCFTDATSPLLLAGGIRDTVIDLVNSPAVLAVPVVLGFTVASALAGLIYFLSQPVESD
jgi:hypothetical protein